MAAWFILATRVETAGILYGVTTRHRSVFETPVSRADLNGR
jgi:hypothetical protein